jgi:hypothetical protein
MGAGLGAACAVNNQPGRLPAISTPAADGDANPGTHADSTANGNSRATDANLGTYPAFLSSTGTGYGAVR